MSFFHTGVVATWSLLEHEANATPHRLMKRLCLTKAKKLKITTGDAEQMSLEDAVEAIAPTDAICNDGIMTLFIFKDKITLPEVKKVFDECLEVFETDNISEYEVDNDEPDAFELLVQQIKKDFDFIN